MDLVHCKSLRCAGSERFLDLTRRLRVNTLDELVVAALELAVRSGYLSVLHLQRRVGRGDRVPLGLEAFHPLLHRTHRPRRCACTAP